MLSFQRAPTQASAAAELLLMWPANRNLRKELQRLTARRRGCIQLIIQSLGSSPHFASELLQHTIRMKPPLRRCRVSGGQQPTTMRSKRVYARCEGWRLRVGVCWGVTCDIAVAHASSCDKLCNGGVKTAHRHRTTGQRKAIDAFDMQNTAIETPHQHQQTSGHHRAPNRAPARSAAAWPPQPPQASRQQ